MNNRVKTGIIGGSGLYNLPQLAQAQNLSIETPFGRPSGDFIVGKIEGETVAFLPRHGSGHVFNPSEVNYRANIWGMKKLGVETLISVSAVGSLREELKPGTLILIDQFIDRTKSLRPATFFEGGMVAHVSFADPVCRCLCGHLEQSAHSEGISVVRGGTYVCIEGPAFSSRAESHLHRAWGASVVGMTNLTEAKLAREAQMCFATIAIATDYDCWREGDDIDLNHLIQVLNQGTEQARKVLVRAIPGLSALSRSCRCRESLKTAVFTQPEMQSAAVRDKLAVLFS